MRSTIKVLIVDDSALIRQMLSRALGVDPRIEIVGVAKTGVEAIEKARDIEPDVITLDIAMPELSGLEALPYLRKYSSARVIMFSSLDDPDTIYQALSLGAFDFMAKPQSGVASSLSELIEVLLKKIKTAYRVDPGRFARITAGDVPDAATAESEKDHLKGSGPPATSMESIVAIASSTGGPPALVHVLAGLSANLPAVYLIVQHLPMGFSASFAKRLSAAGEIEVVEAVHDMPLRPACGYLAPYGTHMVIGESPSGIYRIVLDDSAPLQGVRPAANPLFSSVAQLFGVHSVGVLLTGMGVDGAQGLSEIKAAGGETIAQNEETSVVWGMPGAAAKIGAVAHFAPVDLIATEIRRAIKRGHTA